MRVLSSRWQQIGRIIREYSQVLSGLTIGICSIVAAMIISGGLERVLLGNESIVVTVQGFNNSDSTNRLVLAHNYGSRSGTLMAEAIIVAYDVHDNELNRLTTILNSGFAGGRSPSPFTLPSEEGKRYFLERLDLPDKARSCMLEFRVMQGDGSSRVGQSLPFDCNR